MKYVAPKPDELNFKLRKFNEIESDNIDFQLQNKKLRTYVEGVWTEGRIKVYSDGVWKEVKIK